MTRAAMTTPRTCRYCGGEVTATSPAVDYCRICHYNGQHKRALRDEQIAKFEHLLPGAEVGVEHTGGGCFWLAFRFPDEEKFYVATDGEASLPEVDGVPIPNGWGYVGRHDDNEDESNPDYEGTVLAEPKLLAEHNWEAFGRAYPEGCLTDEQVAEAILADRSARRAEPKASHLTFTFDVSELTEDERAALIGEVSVQAESSEGHPSVPTPTISEGKPQ